MTIRHIIALGFIAVTCITAPVFAQTPYDGLWNVTVLTKAGSCEPSVRYPLTVTDGKVSGAADVSGSIGREGMVKVSIRGAYANGQLNGNGGSGRWNGASGGIACSGRWEATRQKGGGPPVAPQRNALRALSQSRPIWPKRLSRTYRQKRNRSKPIKFVQAPADQLVMLRLYQNDEVAR